MTKTNPDHKPTSARPLRSMTEAEDCLMGLVNYEVKPPPMTLDKEGWHLKEFAQLLTKIDNPHQALPIIHIAGTKGKGSTTHILSALLQASGFKRVGVFTSPHLASFRERIAINSRPISSKAFVNTLNAVRSHLPPRSSTEGFRTTFEVLTAMAFHHFRQSGCEAVVMETGLGGRLDCTNIATARIALLTTIGFDHQRVLGHRLREIAAEKAGIITPGTIRALVGPQMPHRKNIVARAAQTQAKTAGVPLDLFDITNDPILRATPDANGFTIDLRMGDIVCDAILFPALGAHQLDNLRAALLAWSTFLSIEGKRPDARALRKGLANVHLPGRLERVQGTTPTLIDAAHCPASTHAAVQACQSHFPGQKIVLVLGVLADKNLDDMLAQLSQHKPGISLVLTHSPNSPRALPAKELTRATRKYFKKVRTCATLQEALDQARDHAAKHPGTLLLSTGSFYSVAEAQNLFRNK